ncbi:MAG: type I-U CRISPR-associated helicase/endonuclease Cas3 [Planctomycetes bacterium]|nr:type I-U CRISPR-associated helicase/endonuclease Cas3 [Planctomycetota bacterium]
MNDEEFASKFQQLTGFPPFHWQRRLWERFVETPATKWPTVVDIPTGLGKTHVITIWYCAWLEVERNGTSGNFPRRLVYVVNRRTVVDQSTDVVRQLLIRLEKMGYQKPAVSTLRGELADNGDWKRDLTRPAVIIGTVDMIGSKLLFSGYGDSHRTRPLHAGIIGQDTLIVHDEAHLTRPFGKLLREIAKQQVDDGEARPIRVMELSATSVDAERDPSRVFRLELEQEPEGQQKAAVKRRVTAAKRLRLHAPEHDAKTKLVDQLFDVTKKYFETEEPVRVLIFVQSPKDVEALRKKLKEVAGDEWVAVLTGTLRGKERDELVAKNPVYGWFLGGEPLNRTAYLVSTSAGEVGVDFDADHLVCDLTTLDGMIQRLGRVNRRGTRSKDSPSQVDVVILYPKDKKRAERLKATVEALASLPKVKIDDADHRIHDASPHALTSLLDSLTREQKEAAWSSQPPIPALSDILFDAWSLTSLRRSSQNAYPPAVAPWLHGLDDDLPQTHVAWRWDLGKIKVAEQNNDASVLNDVMRRFRLLSHEQLRDRTDRVKKQLGEIVKRLEKNKPKDDNIPSPDQCFAAVQVSGGDWRWVTLRSLHKGESLEYATIVLPVEVGGFDGGLLAGKTAAPQNSRTLDVAEWSTQSNGGGAIRQRVESVDTDENAENQSTSGDDSWGEKRLCHVYRVTLKSPEDDEDARGKYLDYFVPRRDSDVGIDGQSLDQHTKATVKHARQIAGALGLEESLSDALAIAAKCHDDGKNTKLWQRVGCGVDLEKTDSPLAKPPKGWHFNGRRLQGYRHEFGSLIKAAADEVIANHAERDLILHLIAAHHGYARPHFRLEAGHHELGNATMQDDQLHETMRRFARLQRRFGRWGLAWLESLLRCADQLASQPSNEQRTAAASKEGEA